MADIEGPGTICVVPDKRVIAAASRTVSFTSPRLRVEVGSPRRCEASSGAIRV